jgi:hypothetical protein
MPFVWVVTQLPLSMMCCAVWACEESTSSISGGVKSDAK